MSDVGLMYGELLLCTVYLSIRTFSPALFAGTKITQVATSVQLNIHKLNQKDITFMAYFLITDQPCRSSSTIPNFPFPAETGLVQGLTSSSSHLLRRAHSGKKKRSVDRQMHKFA